RVRYVDELRRMGADNKMEQDTAIVRGVQRLKGAPVEMSDLRAGAALVIAALTADGETRVEGAEVLSRGYERIDQKLAALGARIAVEGEIDSDGHFAELCHPMRVETSKVTAGPPPGTLGL